MRSIACTKMTGGMQLLPAGTPSKPDRSLIAAPVGREADAEGQSSYVGKRAVPGRRLLLGARTSHGDHAVARHDGCVRRKCRLTTTPPRAGGDGGDSSRRAA